MQEYEEFSPGMVTIKEALKDKKPYDIIRIGMTNGHGFVFAGAYSDLDWEKLNKKYRGQAKGWTPAPPIEERKVIEVFPSQLSMSSALIYMVEGMEDGREFEHVDKPPVLNADGCTELMGAVYRQVEKQLIRSYKTIKENETKLMAAIQTRNYLESWIMKNAHGMIKDPSSLIRIARETVFGKSGEED